MTPNIYRHITNDSKKQTKKTQSQNEPNRKKFNLSDWSKLAYQRQWTNAMINQFHKPKL